MGKADLKVEESKDKIKLKSRRKEVLPTKIVIRRLPPTLTEEQLKEKWVPLPDHDFFKFEGPDYSLGPVAFSRAYLNFKNFNDIFTFQSKYDGYIFADSKGTEYSAVIEPAPYQKIPRPVKKRKDIKCGTIEKDPDYVSFLESLGKEEESVSSYQDTLQQMEAAKSDPNASASKKTTPLIEFLKAKHAARVSSRSHSNSEKRGGKDGRDADKENMKAGKKDVRSGMVESRGSAMDRKNNERKGKDSRRKEDVKDKKGSPIKEKQQKEGKEGGKETKGKLSQRKSKEKVVENEKPSRASSARSEQHKTKEKDRDKEQGKRSREFKVEKKSAKAYDIRESIDRDPESPQKAYVGNETLSDEQKSHRTSIECDDPIIVAFCKADESKENDDRSTQEKRDQGEERNSSGRVRNKDRPARQIYRPPVRPVSASSRGKEARISPEKTIYSEKEQPYSEKASCKDRYKYPPFKDKDKERAKEREAKPRDGDKDRHRDRERDYERDKDRPRYRGRYSERDRDKGRERERDRGWEQGYERSRGREDDYDYPDYEQVSHRDSGRKKDDRDRDAGRERNRDRNETSKEYTPSSGKDREKSSKVS